jgi:hypothetical protein
VHPAFGASVSNELRQGQVASMMHSKGKHLYCTSGRLWITVENAPEDVILEPNESLDIGENGRVVISALDAGTFQVA